MSYAKSIDGLNIELSTGKLAQSVDSLAMLMSVSTETPQGLVLFSPIDNAINVSVTPSFNWNDTNDFPAYKIQIADNSEFTNAITAYITSKGYTQVEALLNATNYHWKVVGGDVTDRPAIVPDSGFTGMTVWDANTDPAPIYVYDNGGTPIPRIVEAADDLAGYIAKSSGKTAPTVTVQSESFPFPQRCIKIGYPNTLTQREEIQIKCSENGPLELTGVDEFDFDNPDYQPTPVPGQQKDTNYMRQAGTYHSVMTFLHENMGIVWGWPGELGEAVPSLNELKVSTVDKTYTPSCEVRNNFYFSEPGNSSPWAVDKDWIRRQRNFYEYRVIGIGHGFSDYHERFHPAGGNGGDPSLLTKYGIPDIDFFALQQNGTRNGDVGPYAKMEVGEPKLIDLWYDTNVVEATNPTTGNPLLSVFNASFNDGYTSGHTWDARAKAMDYPNQGFVESATLDTINCSPIQDFQVNEHVGKTVVIYGVQSSNLLSNPLEERVIESNTANSLTVTSDFISGVSEGYYYWIQESDTVFANGQPALTDRELLFVKRCADKLNETRPDDIAIFMAYGSALNEPKREQFHENVYITNVSNNVSNPNATFFNKFSYDAKFKEWLQAYPGNQVWRGNTGPAYGHRKGMYYTHVHHVGGKIKEYIPMGLVGFKPDALWGHYSTQWTMYYVISQLMWDHTQNIDDILNKAYDTMFGDASAHIKAYYKATENRIEANYAHGITNEGIVRLWDDLIPTLENHISDAYLAVDAGSDEFKRIEFVEAGLQWCKDLVQSCKYWVEYNAPAKIIDDTELATGANAVESDVDGIGGWESFNELGASGNIISQSQFTNGSDFAFHVDFENRIAAGAIRNIAPLQSIINSTATGGTTTTLIDTLQSFTVDSQINRSIKITSGTNAGEERVIVSNTNDTVTVDKAFSAPIDNTSVYEINDRFLLSVDVRHDGSGTPYQSGSQFSVRLNGDFATVNGVDPNEPFGTSIDPQDTIWMTFKINAYGGDVLNIRRQGDGGGVYIDNFSMKIAKSPDKESIFNAWNDHNSQAVSKIYDSKWGEHKPIGEYVNPQRTSQLPRPDSEDFGGSGPGLE